MLEATTIARSIHLSLAVTLGLLSSQRLLASDRILDLDDDFEWTIEELRSETTVKREIPECVGFTEGTDVEFRSKKKPFTVIAVTLRAQKTGTFDLIPELFIVRDGLQYRSCHGVRVLAPQPDPRTAAFHPPKAASVWPGHAGDRLACRRGECIVVELLFDHVWHRDRVQLLVAAQIARSLESQAQRVRTE